ncbi:MAG TPA: PAS domain S-box protein [Prolixibacteraceae bacterium]|nr:PAS domain S-box protein [Prolixibacteraceae bacterium]
MIIYIIILSIVIQFITAILALRLIRITGKQLSWVFIAVAIFLMASRRISILSGIISGKIISSQVATSEWIGLFISIFLFAGVVGFDKILKRIMLDLKEREQAAEKNLAQVALLNSVHDAIMVRNVDDRIIYWNKGAERKYGWNFEEVSGNIAQDQLKTEFPIPLSEIKAQVAEKGIWEGELIHSRKDGNKIVMNSRWIAHKDQKGHFSGILEINRDITNQKQIEKELRLLNERISTATRSAQVGIWDWDIGNNHLVWDDQMYTLYAIRKKDFPEAFEAWLNGLHPEDRESINRIVQQAIRGEQQYDTEFRIVWPDGTVRWIKAAGQVFFDENKIPLRMVGINFDITDRKKMEKTLRESEEKFRKAFSINPDAIAITRLSDGKFISVNNGFNQIFGYDGEEIIGKTSLEINTWHNPEDRKEFVRRMNENGFVQNFEVKLYTKQRELKHTLFSAAIIDLENTSYILSTVRDITERKLAEQELIDAKERAEESDRLKSAFLANMSHEIRTPLNSIIGFSDLLFDPFYSTEQQMEFAKSIRNSGDNLLVIISDIMDLSKIESGQFQIKKRPFSINDLIIDIQKDYSYKAKEKGIELKLDLPAKNTIIIDSDKARVRQILMNLVTNAIKFTENGSIEIGLKVIDHSIQIHVKDTGIGIPPEFHKIIFERFRQVENSETRRFGGNGLGLAISKNLVEMLGGKIWLESEVGKGSTFYFGLPI